jgi:hypothetical protein
MAKGVVRRSSQDAETNSEADRLYRRRAGERQIRRAGRAYARVEANAVAAREQLYATMRAFADVFNEDELTNLSPVSRPTVRKRVLGKDLDDPQADQTPSPEELQRRAAAAVETLGNTAPDESIVSDAAVE